MARGDDVTFPGIFYKKAALSLSEKGFFPKATVISSRQDCHLGFFGFENKLSAKDEKILCSSD